MLDLNKILRDKVIAPFDSYEHVADRLLGSQQPFNGELDVLFRPHPCKPLVLDAIRYGPNHVRIHVWKKTPDAEYVLFSIVHYNGTWRISSGNRTMVFVEGEVETYQFLYDYLVQGGLHNEVETAIKTSGRILGYTGV